MTVDHAEELMQQFFRERRVVVTGGCGFIGSHLVERLLSLGARQVVVVDSLRYGSVENLGPLADRVTLIRFTLGQDDVADLETVLGQTDYLFHLAAEKHNQSRDTPEAVFRANVVGMHDLLRAAAQAKVKRCVFSSSLYADGRMRLPPMVETARAEPWTVYGITKLAGEQLVTHVERTYGMPGLALRYFFTYGPKQYAGMGYKSVIVKNFERLARGEAAVIRGDGSQVLDYVYVDDVVDATLLAMRSTEVSGEVLNVGSGIGLSIALLTQHMLAVAGGGAIVHAAPDWTAGTARVADISRIRNTLGFSPRIALTDGLARTWRWIKQESRP